MRRLAGLSLGTLFAIGLGEWLLAAAPVFAAELAEIQRRGYLIVGVKENWRPLGFRGSDGELVGYEIDIARRLAEEIVGDADAVEWVPISNQDRLAAVITDEVDMAIAGITLTPSRMRVVQFSVPYYLDGIGFISRDRTITRLNDLRRSSIAVLNGSSAVSRVRFQFPGADMVSVDSYQEAKSLLDRGVASAFAGDFTVLVGWAQEFPDYFLLPDLISAAPLSVTMPKGVQYRPLHELVDENLNQWHASGWLEDRATYWGLP